VAVLLVRLQRESRQFVFHPDIAQFCAEPDEDEKERLLPCVSY
jgi:hypothetical protein